MGDLIAQHCAHLVRLNRRAGTVTQRRYALRRFERWLGRCALDATLDELRAFVERRPRLGDDELHSVEYRAAETTHLVEFYRWCQREDLRLDDPTVRLERPTRPKGTGRPMAGAHVVRALTTAPSPLREWYFIGAYAGLRAFEVAPLRGEDIWGGQILVRDGKGGKQRAVPIHPILETALARMPRTGVWFPHGWDSSQPITHEQLDKRANQWLHEHDIPETFHQLRHWFGNTLRKERVDIHVIRDLMGHSSIATTEIYTIVGANEGAEAILKLPPIEAA